MRSQRQRRRRRGQRAAAVLAGGGGAALLATVLSGLPADAASRPTVLVNSTSSGSAGTDAGTTDYSATGGTETLADAITYLKSHGGGAITFASSLSGKAIKLSSALPDITEAVDVEGPGANRLTIDLNDEGDLDISSGIESSSAISGLTITGGDNIVGGDLYLSSPTSLDRDVISDGTAFDGGGIDVGPEGNVSIADSTIAHNTADSGGGLSANSGSSVTIESSTIADNTGYASDLESAAAGLAIEGSLKLVDSTVSGNAVTDATEAGPFVGGLAVEDGSATIEDSIIAGNSASGGSHDYADLFNYQHSPPTGVVSARFSLIGTGMDTYTKITAGATDILGTTSHPVDALLGPLGANGGSTPTMVPQLGSPAVDSGSSFGLRTDQRGDPRPELVVGYRRASGGDGADIGAVEVQPRRTTATLGNQRITVTTPPSSWPVPPLGRLAVSFDSARIPGSKASKLRFREVALYVGRGHRTKHGYRPNVVLQHLSDPDVLLTLGSLKTGRHTLLVRVTYTRTVGSGSQRLVRTVQRTLHARFTVATPPA